MNIFKIKKSISLLMLVMMLFMISTPVFGDSIQPTVNLGSTEDYAVLAGSTITIIGATTINGSVGGNIGLYPGTSITGLETLTISGTVHQTDAAAQAAKDDLVIAYNDAMGRTPVETIASELGGMTLTPGVYDSSDGKFSITGTLTLDAQGDPEGVFIFKTASTLITASASNVNLINSARFCRTFWGVGSSATLGSNSNFVGHILASQSITTKTGATIQGQLLAQIGAVTLDTSTITNGICEVIVSEPIPDTTDTNNTNEISASENELSATLHIIKHVINDNDRIAEASDFDIHVKSDGVDVAQSPAVGAEAPGTTYTLDAGTYTITEESFEGYTLSYSGDSDESGNIVLASGDEKTVTLTNDDTELPATLHIIKHVINDNTGTAEASDFSLHLKLNGVDVAQSPAVGAEAPGTIYELDAGIYTITEESFEGYTLSYSGDSDIDGNVVLTPGDEKTVTLINNDNSVISPTINATVEGGQLPQTSTPWYNFLLMGVGLVALTVIGLFKIKRA